MNTSMTNGTANLADNQLKSSSKSPSNHARRLDRQLRALDLTLTSLVLLFLAAPMALGWLVGRPRAVRHWGHTQTHFNRWQFDFSDSFMGQVLTRLGVAQWPVLLNILTGHMSWVGPKARPVGATLPSFDITHTVRPGLVNIWDLRQRLAVDFGSEHQADLDYLAQRGLRHDAGLLVRALLVSWMPQPRAAAVGRVGVGDVHFDNIDMTQAIAQVSHMLDGHTTQQMCFVNPACVNIAAHDRGYRRVLARAALVLPDGIGIKLAADLLQQPLKQNVNGTDLFPQLCDMLARKGSSLYLLGGQPEVVQRMVQQVQAQWPTLRIAGYRDGFFDMAQEGQVAAEVAASGADVLLVARGVPMQDIFIDRQLHQLGVKVAIGVGGLFDFVSGRINRAPRWMRDTGLEWVYRLAQEPSRMWQRYLVGNFTFLGRIVLQRLGLRRPAGDTAHRMSTPKPLCNQGQRCVLLATTLAAPDIPVKDFPAALLPMGDCTFLERTLGQLAQLGTKHLDLLVSARPETLRQLVQQGERWGIEVRWHLVKDALTPFATLKSLNLGRAPVLLGHAERWIAPDVLADMVTHGRVLAHNHNHSNTVRWTGWGMATAQALDDMPLHCDEATFGLHLCHTTTQLRVLDESQFIAPCSATELLAAQQVALTDDFMRQVPATWLRASWGAYSPDAVLESGAHIEGPALIGPGCFVAQGAHIGPGTVLTRDVVVSAGSVIRHSVVLPQTLVGQNLELDHTVVNAQMVQHLKLGVRTVLPASEGLLLDLNRPQTLGTSWLARATAAAACVALLPWLAVDTGLRRLRGQPLRWGKHMVVVARDADTDKVQLQALRCGLTQAEQPQHVLTHFGGLLDIVSGHRKWFGARPRMPSEWYAIGRDWQLLLANTPVGCLHAPAWSEHRTANADARAAADVFFAVNQGWAERLRIVRACIVNRHTD